MDWRTKVELFEEIRREYEFGEGTITIKGVARKLQVHRRVVLETNLQAFRWGRLYIQDSASVEHPLKMGAVPNEDGSSAERELQSRMPKKVVIAQELLNASGFRGEIRRLVEIRLAELIPYQNASYATQYLEFVKEAEKKELVGK